jgi:hypothetical protein
MEKTIMTKLVRLKIKFLVSLLVALFLSGCVESQPSPDLFALPVTYIVGKKPEVVIARDMNNDEFPDLLVVNSASNSLNYLEGIGDGTFKNPQIIETGREPFALDVADFNGDGIPDVALCNYGDGNVSIILGQKDGLFKLKTDVKVGRLPIAVAAGDFNNDEKIDLAVTLRFNKLIILLGVGDGTFKLAEAYQAGPTPAYITIDDYNSDGNQDIAMALNADKVKHAKLFLGNGDGTFEKPKRLAEQLVPLALVASDMNDDGKTDLVFAAGQGDNMYLLISKGGGNFKEPIIFSGGGGPFALTTGHFNPDKLKDVAVANSRSSSFSLVIRNPNGTFKFPTRDYVVDGGTPLAITSGDYNHSGMSDIVVASNAKNTIEIYLQRRVFK